MALYGLGVSCTQEKGADEVIDRYRNLYKNSTTMVSLKDIIGRSYPNTRNTLRQGDLPSMYFFAYRIDPLLHLLEQTLTGITIYSTPVQGPCQAGQRRMEPMKEVFKPVAYADDVKPAITTMHEILLG